MSSTASCTQVLTCEWSSGCRQVGVDLFHIWVWLLLFIDALHKVVSNSNWTGSNKDVDFTFIGKSNINHQQIFDTQEYFFAFLCAFLIIWFNESVSFLFYFISSRFQKAGTSLMKSQTAPLDTYQWLLVLHQPNDLHRLFLQVIVQIVWEWWQHRVKFFLSHCVMSR